MPGVSVPPPAGGSPVVPGGVRGASGPGIGAGAEDAAGGVASSPVGPPVLVPGCGAPGPAFSCPTPAAPPPATPGDPAAPPAAPPPAPPPGDIGVVGAVRAVAPPPGLPAEPTP